ncbi:MAG: MarR family transcriptional regulator [Desulfobacter sp.]|nr:MarR family transcriptional regulator [Desulfobacter sp.]WDP84153.1 MAG: MarR family transcriptional regulator [Desulfobacter sp.]
MTVKTNDLPDCTVFLLGKAYQKAHGDFKKQLKPFGLTNMQHLVLEGLWYEQGLTASELGRVLILDKATLSGVLDRMVEGGWILKRQDPEDKRVSRLFPSDKANQMKSQLIDVRKEANERLLSEFNPEERILLKRFLRDLIYE